MRMFWKRREREIPGELAKVPGPLADSTEIPASRPLAETIQLERGTSRAASISRVAEELRRRGEEIVELFKVVTSPGGRAILPIHLRRANEDIFVDVEIAPWERETVEGVLKTAAVLRGSEYSGAVFEVLGAYPVPEEVRYFCGRSPGALFQLDLVRYDDPEKAETCAEAFKKASERHWGLGLNYDPEELPLIEELLLTALGGGPESGAQAPVLDALVRGFGCYAGEILRRRATSRGSWHPMENWGEGLVVEFPNATASPIGKARAFFENGPEDSVAYYIAYALQELNG